MLVYGDRSERADPAACLDRLRRELAALAIQPPGLNRHSRLVSTFIEAGRLLQGLADTDFEATGWDRRVPSVERLGRFLYWLGRSVCRSWDSGFSGLVDLPAVPDLTGLPTSVEMKTVEGYAFYAVYPEAYVEAARALRLSGPPRVIGIRSIGTSLAAAAAAALGAPPPMTLRPTGDPFARYVAVAPDLAEEILAEPEAHYVIVDEGPGLSGSSFGAVADWLEAQGVPLERIAFLPSHASAPGPQASAAHRERWARAQRPAADLGPRLPALLSRWLEETLGPVEALEEISGGVWRSRVYADEAHWPAVDPQQERRKFLTIADGATWLAKFAGLGKEGERKLVRARSLHAAGLVPEPLGLVHGFMVERWHGEARRPFSAPPLRTLVRYISARARLFPAGSRRGASLAELLEMSRRNIGLAAGPEAARALDAWAPLLPQLSASMSPVETDNRMDLHEWLQLPNGRWLKADALDHHAAHDLVGCQDVAWDLAGAAVELDLGPGEVSRLLSESGRALGRTIGHSLYEFLTVAYLAFRLGQAVMAADRLPGSSSDAQRLRARADSFIRRLDRHLGVIDFGTVVMEQQRSAGGTNAEIRRWEG